MVAGHDDDLDARRRAPSSSASRIPSRSGSAKPISGSDDASGRLGSPRATATSRSPAAAPASIERVPGTRLVGRRPRQREDRLRAPRWPGRSRADRTALRGDRDRPAVGDGLGRDEVGRGRGVASPPAASTARASDAVNEPGCDALARGPRRRPRRAGASTRTSSRAGSVQRTRPGRGPRPTSSRLRVSVPVLSVTIRSIAPRVSSALRRRTRTPRRSSRYAPRPRITASRTGGSSGMAAIAAEMPARRFAPASWPRTKPRPVDDRDQADRDDEQDPDEPVELALERRPALARATPRPPAIRPTSVAGPIATTTPSPRPPTTLVPAYAIDRAIGERRVRRDRRRRSPAPGRIRRSGRSDR